MGKTIFLTALTEILICIMFIFVCCSFVRINQISNELETIKSQNDSLKQEIVLLNNYLYD